MKKRLLATVMVFSLIFTMALAVAATNKPAQASRWGGDDMDDWPLQISCDPDFPIIGPEVGEDREESIMGLQYDKGNRMTSFKVKNYSPKIVKISKIKKNTEYGGNFYAKGLKKGYAHIKVIIKLKYAQDGKKKYVWNIKKYPVGHNED